MSEQGTSSYWERHDECAIEFNFFRFITFNSWFADRKQWSKTADRFTAAEGVESTQYNIGFEEREPQNEEKTIVTE